MKIRLWNIFLHCQKYLKFAPNSDEKEEIKKKVDLLASGEMVDEQGFLDKLLGLFSKK